MNEELLRNAGLSPTEQPLSGASGFTNAGKGYGGARQSPSPSKLEKERKAADEDEDDDNEYVDDMFEENDIEEEEEESASNPPSTSLRPISNIRPSEYPSNVSHKAKENYTTLKGGGGSEVDFNISASASMLPPLAGGTIKQGAEAMMSNFNVNLADSQSLDYNLSGSGFGPPPLQGSGQQRRLTAAGTGA